MCTLKFGTVLVLFGLLSVLGVQIIEANGKTIELGCDEGKKYDAHAILSTRIAQSLDIL